MTPIETVLNQLPDARQYGDRYRAKCPVHQRSQRQSLDVREGDDGRVLFHCFGGCDTEAIVRVLGLRWTDLFTSDRPRTQRPIRRRRVIVDMERLKNTRRQRITASALYAALYLAALLRDDLPPMALTERMGCYLGLCDTLGHVYCEDGYEATRLTWQSWQDDLRRQAPVLVAMLERVQP